MLDKPLSDGCGRASLRYALPVRTVRRRQHAIGRKDRLERVTVRGCPHYPWMWLALIETALAFGELACNQTSTVRLGQVSRYSPLSTTTKLGNTVLDVNHGIRDRKSLDVATTAYEIKKSIGQNDSEDDEEIEEIRRLAGLVAP